MTNSDTHRFDTEKKTLIVGMGKTGVSCARFLSSMGVELAITDSRENPPGLEFMRDELPNVAVYAGGFDSDVFDAAEQLVVSPGVPLRDPQVASAVMAGTPVLGDIELFAQHVTAPVVAVTGSNGKSTVTMLLAEMARKAGQNVLVGGNLGTPALDLLAQQETDSDLFVLELSSFQLETTYSLNAVAAVVLNVSADHMDRYDSLEEYARVKQRIYRGDGIMVVNKDDPRVMAMANSHRKVVHFGLSQPGPNDFGLRKESGETWLSHGETCLIAETDLALRGRHNTANALAALALGTAIGLENTAMLDTLREFQGLPHRCQWVASQDGIEWYNDSKATNVGAMLASVKGLDGPLVLIAGGDGKGADFSALKQGLAGKVRLLILLGADAGRIRDAVGDSVPVILVNDMKQAVVTARHQAQAGDKVLLSPACASFDMFSGFEQRGEVFMQAVREVLS